ncbi:hypothetical protein [Bacillus sp. FJAT-45066]|uniref:hypothetical protein n=1 Tax=Bacillus sp. FJAT-45066 TaxID=2011010 RepID=UPI000BB8D8DE|nr:hypothetical protein [Bacillus sp. FJAT-45066]
MGTGLKFSSLNENFNPVPVFPSADFKNFDSLQGKVVLSKPSRTYAFYSSVHIEANKKGEVAAIVIPPSSVDDYASLYFSPFSILAVTTEQKKEI